MNPDRRTRLAVICAALALLTLAAFEPVLHNGFTNYDDITYVTGNRFVQRGIDGVALRWAFTTTHAANWHPLTWLSHMLDWSLYGAQPFGHHLTSVLLHIANALLLFLALERLTGAWGASLAVAALFAVHPVHVESVAWVAERKDVLSTLFWLLATLAYVRYARAPSPRGLAIVALLMAAGLMAKPMLVTLPFTLLLLDFWPLARQAAGWRKLVIEKLPLFALAGMTCVATFLAQRAGSAVATLDAFSAPARIANAVWSYVAYLGLTFWPSKLAVFYPHVGAELAGWKLALAALALVAITAFAWGWRRSHPHLIVGWLWYLGTLVPVIGLVQVGEQGIADRYTYVPLIGIFVMLAWSIPQRARHLVLPGAVAVILVCVALTRAQAAVWRDSRTLFEHALRVTPENAIPHVNLGGALADAGDDRGAEAHLRRAIELAPNNAIAHFFLGNVLRVRGEIENAQRSYRAALKWRPGYAEAWNNLGVCDVTLRAWPDAERAFREADRLRDDYADAKVNLGNVLRVTGRAAEAIPIFEAALALDPGFAAAREGLDAARREVGAGSRPRGGAAGRR